MADLFSLANRLEKYEKQLPSRVNTATQKIIEAVLNNLLRITPVDTSKAMSNWQIVFDSESSTSISAYAVGTKGSTRKTSYGAALAAGINKLSAKKPSQAAHIVNNTDYIRDLDDGKSPQFTGGFARRARAVASSTFKEIKL